MRSIFHPTDFSAASRIGFAHALRITLGAAGTLKIMHVAGGTEVDWSAHPGVRETLAQWGHLPPGSRREDVGRLGIRVKKVSRRDDDPLHGLLRYLERSPADLVVLATHRRRGLARWSAAMVAAPLTQQAAVTTLYLPEAVSGFVCSETGVVRLRRILFPVAAKPDPHLGLRAGMALAQLLGCEDGQALLYHVGPTMPSLRLPAVPGWRWERRLGAGEVVDGVVEAATAVAADLIVLVTAGHDGLLDALRGSITERIVSRAPCPVLAVPRQSGGTADD